MERIRANSLPYLHSVKFTDSETCNNFLDSLDYGTIIVLKNNNNHILIKQGFIQDNGGRKTVWSYLIGSHREYKPFGKEITIQIRQDLMSMINLATFAIHKQNTGLIINELGTVFHA